MLFISLILFARSDESRCIHWIIAIECPCVFIHFLKWTDESPLLDRPICGHGTGTGGPGPISSCRSSRWAVGWYPQICRLTSQKKHVYSPIWGDFATDFRRPFGHGFPGLTHVNPLADSPGVIFQHQTPQAVTHGISILFGVDPSIFYPGSRYFPGSSEIISYHIIYII